MRKLLTAILFSLATGVYAHVPEDNTAPTQVEIDGALQQLKNSMIYVEGGTFMMGATTTDSHTDANQLPAHQVTLSPFYVSKYEVTQALWRAVMGKLGAYSSTNDYSYPVTYRSHDEIHEFIDKLNQLTGEHYRLLTEAEWEFAARGGNQSKGYIYAGSNNYADVSHGFAPPGTKIVETIDDIVITSGSMVPNELELYDMSGNVAELVEDNYYEYTSDPQENPLFRNESGMVISRGGGAASNYEWEYRVTAREAVKQHSSSGLDWVGFRLAKDGDQQLAKHRPFFISYSKGGEEQQATVDGIRFVPSQYGNEAYAWQPSNDEWQTYTSLAADGFDIQNVRSISRTRIELTESKGEELQQALEEEARSGTADVNAIVAALQENPNVADAQTDGTNVMILENGSNALSVYPTIIPEDPFSDKEMQQLAASLVRNSKAESRTTKGQPLKVAIFNYFSGANGRFGQNILVDALGKMLMNCGYEIDKYNYNRFTYDNIEKVVKASKESNQYAAIFIFSHGFFWDSAKTIGQFMPGGYFVTGEEWKGREYPYDPVIDEHHHKVLGFNVNNYYNFSYPISKLQVNKECLLYVGSCHAFDRKEVTLDNVPWIGWSGVNSMAQAHAAIMVAYMLEGNKTVNTATKYLWTVDDSGGVLKKNTDLLDIGFVNSFYDDDKDYDENLRISIEQIGTEGKWDKNPPIYRKVLTSANAKTELDFYGHMHNGHKNFRICFVPMREDEEPWHNNVKVKKDGEFALGALLPKNFRGIYRIEAQYNDGLFFDDWRNIRMDQHLYVVCSDKFKANDVIVPKPAKDSKIVMTTAKAPGEQLQFGYYYDKDIWFDMNNNGVRETGEYPDWEAFDYTTFQPTVQSQTFTIYGDITGSFDCGSDNFEHDYNRLTSIDMSEYYGGMEQLFCAYNELTELILPKGTELNYVWAADNKLTEVDASGLSFLETLILDNNQLTSLKLPESSFLRNLDVQSNHSLKTIDLSEQHNLTGLHCQNCIIEELDVSQNPELTELLCDGNRITSLNLLVNKQLLVLGCNYNQLDKEALESIYQQLPDVSGDIDSLENKLWLPQLFRMLRANGNPGYSEADQSIATKKGWEFGDKWNYGTRSSQQAVKVDGGGARK